jgi:Fic family protein
MPGVKTAIRRLHGRDHAGGHVPPRRMAADRCHLSGVRWCRCPTCGGDHGVCRREPFNWLVTLKVYGRYTLPRLQSQPPIEGMWIVPELVKRRWEGDPGAYGGRRARQSFEYEAFIPDPIALLDPAISFRTAGTVLEAEDSIRALNARADARGLEAIGPLLLRSEALASSRIEGYQVSALNLAKALIDPRAARGVARTVAANVSAMEVAIGRADDPRPLDIADIQFLHATLMANEPQAGPGLLRDVQNWIGGRLNNPSDAAFVPPPPDEVPRLVGDLLGFLSRDDVPAVAQAAIAHAQFETIHPFIDGNGRIGRCLIHVILRRAGVAPTFVPPVSIVLAARPSSYVQGLVDFREGRIGPWVESFAGACLIAARHAAGLADDVRKLQKSWMDRAETPRSDSAAAKIITLLPAQPVLSAPTIRAAVGASQQQVLAGLKVLADSGVVRQISEGTYDRQFAATELIDLVADYEARIAGRAQPAGLNG